MTPEEGLTPEEGGLLDPREESISSAVRIHLRSINVRLIDRR